VKQAALLSFLSLIWCVAVLIKLSAVRSRGQPYVFTTWDGGLMLRGRQLGRTGSTMFAAFCIAVGGVAAWVFFRAAPQL